MAFKSQSKFNALELLARIRADNVLSSSLDSGQNPSSASQNKIYNSNHKASNGFDDKIGAVEFDSNKQDNSNQNRSIDSISNNNSSSSSSSNNANFNDKNDPNNHSRSNNSHNVFEDGASRYYIPHQYESPTNPYNKIETYTDNKKSEHFKNRIKSARNTFGIDDVISNSYKNIYNTNDDEIISDKDYFSLIRGNEGGNDNNNYDTDNEYTCNDYHNSHNNIHKNSNSNDNNDNYNNSNNNCNKKINNRNNNNNNNNNNNSDKSNINNNYNFDDNNNNIDNNYCIDDNNDNYFVREKEHRNNFLIEDEIERNSKHGNDTPNLLQIRDFDSPHNFSTSTVITKSNYHDDLYDEINKLKNENTRLQKLNKNLTIAKIEFEISAQESKKKNEDIISNLRCTSSFINNLILTFYSFIFIS